MAGHYGGNPFAWDAGINTPHVSRYFLARGWVMPGETVLDAACATGYGSYLISQVAGKVISIDVDQGCINEADARWKTDNMELRCANLDEIEWPDADVLISIETFEHVNDIQHCLEQARKHIKRVMIITVPLGGTSWDYTPEQLKLPAGECNDFADIQAFENIFAQGGWKTQVTFQFGYSGFGVFYKKPPDIPAGYDERGYRIHV